MNGHWLTRSKFVRYEKVTAAIDQSDPAMSVLNPIGSGEVHDGEGLLGTSHRAIEWSHSERMLVWSRVRVDQDRVVPFCSFAIVLPSTTVNASVPVPVEEIIVSPEIHGPSVSVTVEDELAKVEIPVVDLIGAPFECDVTCLGVTPGFAHGDGVLRSWKDGFPRYPRPSRVGPVIRIRPQEIEWVHIIIRRLPLIQRPAWAIESPRKPEERRVVVPIR